MIYDSKKDKFYYIDWRDSFGGSTNGGDLYYDLAKFYGGLLIPYNKMSVASPKKLKKPTTSVTVVKITVDPIAGSIPAFRNPNGISVPKNPAKKRLITMESAITTPNKGILNHKNATVPITIEKINNSINNLILDELDTTTPFCVVSTVEKLIDGS